LNAGFAEDWSWYCYNVIKGDPRSDPPQISSADTEETVWEYQNDTDRDFTDTWTESWTKSSSASLSITKSSSISLGVGINIKGVVSTDFNITIASDSTKEESKSETYELSHTWEMKVQPHETMSLIRKKTTKTGTQVYYQGFGLDSTPSDLIATKGERYDGHYYYGYSANNYLNNPSGTMNILGSMKSVSFTFHLKTVKRDGGVIITPVSMPTEATISGSNETVRFAVAGGPKED